MAEERTPLTEPPVSPSRRSAAKSPTCSAATRPSSWPAVVAAALPLTFVFDPVTPLVLFLVTLAVGRLLGGLPLKAQLRPLAVFVLAGIAILLANIFFNKQNATSRGGLLDRPGGSHAAPLCGLPGSLWLRLLVLRAAIAGVCAHHRAAAPASQPRAPTAPERPGGLRGHGRLPHAPGVPGRLCDHSSGSEAAGGAGGQRPSPSVLADPALCPAPADRSGAPRRPDRYRHGRARVRSSASAHVPGEDGGHLRPTGCSSPWSWCVVALVVTGTWWSGIGRFTVS